MNFIKFEKIRMKYFPLYLGLSIFIGLLLIGLLIFIVFPSYTFLKYLISAIILIILLVSLFSVLFITDKKFYKTINKPFVDEILTPIIKKELNMEPITSDLDKIKINTGLFGSNKPKVKEFFKSQNLKVYEVSVWKDYKFHGICIEMDVLNKQDFEFAFLNYKYFIKLKFNKDFKKITGYNNFDNKFKLYSKKHFKLNENFFKEFYRHTHFFKSISFEINKNKVYVVYDVLDTAFQPAINKKIDNTFISSLGYHIKQIKKIKKILEVFNK